MMKGTVTYFALLGVLLFFSSSPVQAGVCTTAITRAQAQVDKAIDSGLSEDGWKPESLSATRGYQPTPRSLARTEGPGGVDLQQALDLLDRARESDRSGNAIACRRQLANVRLILHNRK